MRTMMSRFVLVLASVALASITLTPTGPAFAAETKTKAQAKPAANVLKLDTASSEIKWEGSKKLVKSAHYGTLKLKSGEIELNGDQLTGGTFEIDMMSLENTDLASDPKMQAKLLGHLKSDDFFSVEKHPTAMFKIKSIKALKSAKAGEPSHEITGSLTIKGKTDVVAFPAIVTMAGDKAQAKANLTIDRTKWGIRYGSGKFFDNLGDKVINDDIKLDLSLVANK